jgi:acyl carrier protein
MNTPNDSTDDRIVTVVQSLFKQRSIIRTTIHAEDNLIEFGLTSLDTVKLVLLVEDEFDLTLPISDITPANFRSIATISQLVARLLSVS